MKTSTVGRTGIYAWGEYIRPNRGNAHGTKNPPALAVGSVKYMAKVKTRFPLSLNIWQNPNKGKSIAKVPNKETVEVLQEYNYTWAKIRYKGTVGYSDRQYLEKV